MTNNDDYLFGKFLLQDGVVFRPDLLHTVATHPLSYQGHLLQGEDLLLRLAAGLLLLHHGLGGAGGTGWGGGGGRWGAGGGRAATKLPPSLQSLDFISQVVGDLFWG